MNSPARAEAPPGALRAAADRGRTVVTRQAVERIAARVVAECPQVEGAPRRMLSRQGTRRGDDGTAAARLHGATAVSLSVRCSVPYPRPVARSAEALRSLLVSRVAELTGLRVQRADITVASLAAPSGGRRAQ